MSSGNSTLTLVGASGAKYTFTLHPWGTPFNPVCAVYSISADQRNGYHNVIYVGQTGDCSERFDAHHKADFVGVHSATHIGLLIENAEARRLAIETDLVGEYDPPCNG